jgi:hypothetical protein
MYWLANSSRQPIESTFMTEEGATTLSFVSNHTHGGSYGICCIPSKTIMLSCNATPHSIRYAPIARYHIFLSPLSLTVLHIFKRLSDLRARVVSLTSLL